MYVEKPLGLSLDQAKLLRREIADHDCIFQYGTQQRSGAAARLAMELVWNGHVGEIERVDVCAPHLDPDKRMKCREEPVPEGFNYDLWLGPAPKKPYCTARCETESSWHCYDYALGFIAGWVCYSRGVCYLHRGGNYVNTRTIDRSGDTRKAYVSASQHGNFIDCMKSRQPTINPLESAIRSDTISHLGNIAARTGRKLNYDPQRERITGDEAANAMLNRPAREGYGVAG